MRTISELDEAIRKSPDNALSLVYDHLDALWKSRPPGEAIPELIQLIESNPEADFGNPGPIAHHCEAECDEASDIYLSALTASVRRSPTYSTLVMFTRLWSHSPEAKQVVTSELRRIVSSSGEWSELAEEFLANIER